MSIKNRSAAYFKGLVIRPYGNGTNKIHISPGFFIPGHQQDPYWQEGFTYIHEATDTVVDMIVYNDGVPHMDYIIATPKNLKYGNTFAGMGFRCKSEPLGKARDNDPEFPNSLKDNEILLGFVFNPAVKSNNYHLVTRSVNLEDEGFSYKLQPSNHRRNIITGVEEWEPGVFYIKQQIAYHNATLYYCKMTHASSTDFGEDLEWYWIPICCGGGLGDLGDLIQDIINNLTFLAKPAPPIKSVQFNLDLDHFGGDEHFLWDKDTLDVILDGQIQFISKKNVVDTPAPGSIRLYAEERGDYIYLKLKLESGIEYIISSFKKYGVPG